MRRYPDRPIVGVGAVLLDAGRVLLVRRAHEPLKDEWSLPGGAIEIGETAEAAVMREALEETGLEIEVGPLVDAVSRITSDAGGRVEYHFVVLDYLCRAVGGTLACASDAAEAEWAVLDDLDRYRLTDAARGVIRKAAMLSLRR
jgi:8-oxo-dGTP diphosphatase